MKRFARYAPYVSQRGGLDEVRNADTDPNVFFLSHLLLISTGPRVTKLAQKRRGRAFGGSC